jgi:N-acetylmuramic acid 6-phosphate etherase
MNLDVMPVAEGVALMNQQDHRAVEAVAKEKANVARAIELVVGSFRTGGRLIYAGAGTSGRLGVLDASECPPTFRTDPDLVQGIIAGGPDAMFRAQEGAEDSSEQGGKDIEARQVTSSDTVMGIATGGTTPYVHGALRRAAELGAKTIFLSCVQSFPGEPRADVIIRPLTGPEVLTGSTRLKAGTATKLVLNTITTLAMVQIGKVYENLMVDLRASNQKLRDRAARIVCTLTGASRDVAMASLDQCDGHVKVAIVMIKRHVTPDDARELLDRAQGQLRTALAS